MKKFLISFITFTVMVTVGELFLKKKKEEDKKVKKIIPISGGAYHLVLHKNNEEEKEYMHVGIACSPDSYLDLPIPKKEGYTFDGWYYDEELKKKVEVTNTREIPPVPEREDDCIVGYQDISLYAKWKKK